MKEFETQVNNILNEATESFQSWFHNIKIEQPCKFQLLTMHNKIVQQEQFKHSRWWFFIF